MMVKSAEFITSAVKPDQYPETDLPEIAFAGRSNVGKSSLINTLLNRKRLVKTSSTPGRTQLINFFVINEAFHFVDLPGYGYAKVPPAIKKQWGPMVERYLSARKTLVGVVLLLDIRRTPKTEELDFMDWLDEYALPRVLVATKADKLSKAKQKQQADLIARKLGTDTDGLFTFSAKSRQGLAELWEAIESLL